MARTPARSDLEACLRCGSMCCTYFCLEIDTPTSRRDFENIKWYVCHQGVKVYRADSKWHLLVENRCRSLSSDGTCKSYSSRPLICREYDPLNCEGSGSFEYDLMFETPEAVSRFAEDRFRRKKRRPASKPKGKRYVPPRATRPFDAPLRRRGLLRASGGPPAAPSRTSRRPRPRPR